MKTLNHLKFLIIGAILAMLPLTSSAYFVFDFLTPVRSEVTNQLFTVTNTVPQTLQTRKLATSLKAAQKLLDRTNAATLAGDVTALNALYTNLSKTTLSNTFVPLLGDAADGYYYVLTTNYFALSNNLTTALKSLTKTTASNTLAQIAATLTKAQATNLTQGIKLLVKAANASKTASTLVTRSMAVTPGANRFTATINGVSYAVTGLLGPGHPTGVLGNYTDATHVLTIATAKLSGTTIQTVTINVGAVNDGTSVHAFGQSGAEAIASYIKAGLGVNVAAASVSGSVTTEMNAAHRFVTGSYTINMTGNKGNVVIKGTFQVNY